MTAVVATAPAPTTTATPIVLHGNRWRLVSA